VFLSFDEYCIMMESIRPLKENPELAKELADILLPYIMESVEYKCIVETREKLNALVEAVRRLQEAVNRNSEDIRAMQEDIKLLHEDNKKLWEAIDSLTRSVQRLESWWAHSLVGLVFTCRERCSSSTRRHYDYTGLMSLKSGAQRS
jgi:predicted nuclease with TOPRIM domain